MQGGRCTAMFGFTTASPTTLQQASRTSMCCGAPHASRRVASNVQNLAFRASHAVRGTLGRHALSPQTETATALGCQGVKQETSCRVKLRFKRMGRKKRPFYRLVAIDSRRKREGLALEELGWYNPLTKETYINAESVQKWLSDGAEPSDTVASLLKKAMPTLADKK